MKSVKFSRHKESIESMGCMNGKEFAKPFNIYLSNPAAAEVGGGAGCLRRLGHRILVGGSTSSPCRCCSTGRLAKSAAAAAESGADH